MRYKNKIKYITAILLPPITLLTLRFIKLALRLTVNWSLIQSNKKLFRRYSNDVVYVLGNGPSLNNFDLTSIYGCKVITMNHFELHPDKNRFQIVAHCIGESYPSDSWENPTSMIEGVSAETYWFNVTAARYFKGRMPDNYHFYCAGFDKSTMLFRGHKLSGLALSYQSTSQMAINVAMFLGFSEINLLGFDHDWLVTRGVSPHFYDESDLAEKADFSKYSYTEMIRKSLRLFEIYTELKKISRYCECRIYNITIPSYLDIFPSK